MSELTTIARPYAQAAFQYAAEHNTHEKWGAMLCLAAEVAKHELVQDALAAGTKSGVDLFLNICGEELDEQGQNLIKVMAENQRLVALPEVFELFVAYCAEADKEVEVEVTSATELSDEQVKDLTGKLETRLGRKVKLATQIDESLVAGVIIRTGDEVIDGSVRGQLDRLADRLQS